jgi:lipid-A-disaccharide synthase-like uncharacterized protein
MEQQFFAWLTDNHRFAGFDWSYLVVIGFTGQAVFGSRFVMQWLQSERLGRSVVPKLFWHLSIVGSLILLVYFVLRREPVGALGMLPNSLIYLRNLQLIRKAERNAAPAG